MEKSERVAVDLERIKVLLVDVAKMDGCSQRVVMQRMFVDGYGRTPNQVESAIRNILSGRISDVHPGVGPSILRLEEMAERCDQDPAAMGRLELQAENARWFLSALHSNHFSLFTAQEILGGPIGSLSVGAFRDFESRILGVAPSVSYTWFKTLLAFWQRPSLCSGRLFYQFGPHDFISFFTSMGALGYDERSIAHDLGVDPRYLEPKLDHAKEVINGDCPISAEIDRIPLSLACQMISRAHQEGFLHEEGVNAWFAPGLGCSS